MLIALASKTSFEVVPGGDGLLQCFEHREKAADSFFSLGVDVCFAPRVQHF